MCLHFMSGTVWVRKGQTRSVSFFYKVTKYLLSICICGKRCMGCLFYTHKYNYYGQVPSEV